MVDFSFYHWIFSPIRKDYVASRTYVYVNEDR